jgi:hypothetical protein
MLVYALSTKVGLLVSGTGFNEYAGGEIGFVLDSNETSAEWIPPIGVNFSPGNATVDQDGSFSQKITVSHNSNLPYNPNGEKVVLFLRSLSTTNNASISNKLIINVIPTEIALPVALEPVTLYTATDYSDTSAAAVKAAITTTGGEQLAVKDLTLRGEEGEVQLSAGKTLSIGNGVTASATIDSSKLAFRTPPEGAAAPVPSQILTITGKGLSIANDGDAVVAGLRTLQQIATLPIEVKDGGSFIFSESMITFKAGEEADKTVTITPDPAGLQITGIQVFDSEGNDVTNKTDESGLAIAAGSDNKSIIFSGTPTKEIGENFKVVVTTSDGRKIDVKDPLAVKVTPADKPVPIYTASIPGGTLGDENPGSPANNIFWAVGNEVETSFNVSIRDENNSDVKDAPVDIEITDENGNPIGIWNGLEFSVSDKTVTVKGVPEWGTSGETGTLYVNVSSGTADVTPGRIPLKVVIDSAERYDLVVNPDALRVPVGEDFITNVDLFTTPHYDSDMTARQILITDKDGQLPANYTITWNELTITAKRDVAANKCFLEISGKAAKADSATFTIYPNRGRNMNATSLTITTYDDVETSPKADLVTSDPITVDTGDDEIQIDPGDTVESEIGKTTQIIYNVSADMHINIETINVQYDDSSGASQKLDHLTNDQYADLFGENLNAWYYDKANEKIILYVTPQEQGERTYRIFYYDGAEMNEQPVVVRTVTNTTYNYSRKKSGCETGAAGIFGFSLLAAVVTLIQKRRRMQTQD